MPWRRHIEAQGLGEGQARARPAAAAAELTGQLRQRAQRRRRRGGPRRQARGAAAASGGTRRSPLELAPETNELIGRRIWCAAQALRHSATAVWTSTIDAPTVCLGLRISIEVHAAAPLLQGCSIFCSMLVGARTAGSPPGLSGCPGFGMSLRDFCERRCMRSSAKALQIRLHDILELSGMQVRPAHRRRYWPMEENPWPEGIISDYREETDEHCIVYNINTPQESYEWFRIRWVSATRTSWTLGSRLLRVVPNASAFAPSA